MTELTTEHSARFAASVKYENDRHALNTARIFYSIPSLALSLDTSAKKRTRLRDLPKLSATSTDTRAVIGGDNLSLAGATLLNGYLITAVPMPVTFTVLDMTHVTPVNAWDLPY